MPDYPDYTRAQQIIGSDVMIPIDIQGAYIMMPVDIQAQYITLAIDITAQTIGNLDINIADATIGEISVNITAQDLANLNITINAQNIGVQLQPDWQAYQGNDKNFYGTGGDVATGYSIVVLYTVTAGKTLYLVSAGASLWAHAAANRNNNQICCLFVQVNGVTVFAIGGNGGASVTYPKPIKVTAGVQVGIYAGNYSNQNGDLQVCGFGYEV